jgi:hypothetical protein
VSRRGATFGSLPLLALLLATHGASAEGPTDSAAQADALFRSAKSLRDAGKLPEACAAFAQSKRLDAGIGVSLYLGDCYEKIGRLASAWAEFRDAEARARARKDNRAEVARARAAAIEPRLGHIGIALSPVTAPPGSEIKVDDAGAVASASWTTIAADPGEHVVKLEVGGKVVRAVPTKVRAGKWAIVRLDPARVASEGVLPREPAREPPQLTSATEPIAPSGGGADASVKIDTRQALGYTLLAAGAIGTAIGAGLVVAKNQSLSTGAPNGTPSENQSDKIGSEIAFAVGGAALVSAVILYLTAPPAKDSSALVVAPGPITGGAGAFLSARF